MGFVIFLALGLYLLVSVVVVGLATGHAQKKGKSALRWGGGAALVMFLIPFWDWIPTVAVHQYYCSKDAGFWVYKTLDQWKVENSGVLETLVANEGTPPTRVGDDTNFTDTYFLNKRINKVVQKKPIFSALHIFRIKQEVIDTKTNQVLARYVDFSSGYPNGIAGIAPRNAGITAGKFWLARARCSDGGMHPQHQFYEFERLLTGR